MAKFDAFQPNATGHTWANAYLLSLASLYIYENQVGVPPGLPPGDSWGVFQDRFRLKFGHPTWGMDRFSFQRFAQRGTECAVMSNDTAVIVVFRGTELNLVDWINNLRGFGGMRQVTAWGSNVWVHADWYDAIAGAFYGRLRGDIKEHMAGNRRVWLTGHSLGGVLSVLMAFKLCKQEGIDVQGVCTFGAPMAGNDIFGMKYAPLRQKTQRWVNEGDPVPLLPCDNRLPPCTYRHVGVTNNIYAGGAIQLNDNERHYAPDATTAAHSMTRYCMLIHNKLPTDLRRQFRDPLG